MRLTDADIRAEVDWLTANKTRIRKINGFGDDNHAGIDAQIDVLKNRLDNDDIYDTYGDEDSDDYSESILSHALDALAWLEGDSGSEKPSDGWKGLVR